MIVFLCIAAVLVFLVMAFMQQPQFGRAPSGKRLKRMKLSPNYREGKFQNLLPTPTLTEGYSMTGVICNFLFRRYPGTRPSKPLPHVKTDLRSLSREEDLLVWFGHSSYFIQFRGIRFLVDPVFSGNAAPIPGSNKSFPGTDVFTADDMPDIDYLLITHDHYDHLDYKTIVMLRPRIGHVVCGLGVGAHFERWKFDPATIIEKDWHEQLHIAPDITLYTAPARHFSGRSLVRNNTLWMSFVLQADDYSMYLGGDSGYGPHFSETGERFGGFDLAILDNGQYNPAWRAIHMLPEDGLRAAQDLKARLIFPVHSSKFKLALHPWDEPLRTITELNDIGDRIPLATPRIGEVMHLGDSRQTFSRWWETEA